MMQRPGIYSQSSFTVQFLLLFGLCAAGLIFSQFLFISFTFLQQGFSTENVMKVLETFGEDGDTLRSMQFFQTAIAFLFPALLAARLFGGDEKKYLFLETPVSGKSIAWAVIGILVAIPMINALAWLNEQIRLPESMSGIETFFKTSEESVRNAMNLMLYTDNPATLLMNVLIVAVLAAVSEEFLFRGVLQNIFGKMISNPHLVIWVVAVIFSAVHFQFYGFIPRILLGAYLGYLLYYSKSMLVPVIAHFANNFVSIIPYYKANPAVISELDAIGTDSNWWLAVVSFFVWLVMFSAFKKSCKIETKEI